MGNYERLLNKLIDQSITLGELDRLNALHEEIVGILMLSHLGDKWDKINSIDLIYDKHFLLFIEQKI